MFRRILIYNTILVILVVSILGMSLIGNVRSVVVEEGSNLRSQKIEVGYTRFNEYFRNMQSVILDGCVDDDLQSILINFDQRDDGYYDSIVQISRKLLRGTNLLDAEIYPISDGTIYHYSLADNEYHPLLDNEYYAFEKILDDRFGLSLSSRTGVTLLRASHVIYDMRNWQEPIGIISVDVPTNALVSLLRDMTNDGSDSVCLFDDEGYQIIPTNVSTKFPLDKYDISRPLMENVDGTLYFVKVMPEFGLRLVGVIGETNLMHRWVDINKTIVGVSVFLCIVVIIFISIHTRSLIDPITKLAKHMRNGSKNNEPIAVDDKLTDEVKTLYTSFNEMQARKKDLINQVYVARIEEQDAQMRALMAQINPHFLYNTLDSINWMAMKYNAADIQLMISSLATMLRNTLNKGNTTILLRNEIEQVKSYIQIQQIRFKDWFEVEYDIDEELLDMSIIKLILQPLVENAINHGFERNGKAKLVIEVSQDDFEMVLKVKNNGKKIDLDRVRKVMSGELNTEGNSGYGLRNVNARLIGHYGNKAALQFTSEDGWTIATISIPL